MKRNACLLFTFQLLILLCSQLISAQQIATDEFPSDKNETDIEDRGKLFEKPNLNILEIEDLFEPDSATLVNFDDITGYGTNSYSIAPNRYAGVTFYAPSPSYAETYVTYTNRYSIPNSLIVGYPTLCSDGNYGCIGSNGTMIIDLSQPSKEISFLWKAGFNTYNTGRVQVINDSNQTVADFTVGISYLSWTSISLNQYTRVKRIILSRPYVSDPLFGHIYIDDFRFNNVPSNSPVGFLDGVNIQTGKAWGWSRDPDDTTTSNYVDCYVNNPAGQGVPLPRVVANLSGEPAVGAHRFEVPIPIDFRDGVSRQLYCYGIDIAGGDPPAQLSGSPKTFKFNAPEGHFDEVTVSDGIAKGWSRDPDLPGQPNMVDLYLNAPAGQGGFFLARVVADQFHSAGVGNHGFSFPIPDYLRDNVQRSIYAYGIDLTGDNSKPLGGNPKTFQLSPGVQTTNIEELYENQLDTNPNDGGGLRIFPERTDPMDNETRNSVNVKVKISSPIAGVSVYFKSFDLDEPSTDYSPIDISNNSSGNDNRSSYRGAFVCPKGICDELEGRIYRVQTNASGEASLVFTVGNTSRPGDNYVAVASTKETDLIDANIINEGSDIRSSVTNETFMINKNRTNMLTVWRKLHLEIDSMGVVEENAVTVSASQPAVVGTTPVTIQISSLLEPGRFENGRMSIINGTSLNTLYIDNNNNDNVTVHTDSGTVSIPRRAPLILYDDDDFNNNYPVNGFNADNGENVTILNDSLNLLQPNDDKDCSDLVCNVFADAYIVPEYNWGTQYTSETPFVLNFDNENRTEIINQIEAGKYPNAGERYDWWVAYVQIAYQPLNNLDCDPIGELTLDGCFGGITPIDGILIDEVTPISVFPLGGEGSLVFIETTRDANIGRNRAKIRVVPHEIGHQFGIKGDSRTLDCGIMCYGNGITFSDEHLNVIRWRLNSPGH